MSDILIQALQRREELMRDIERLEEMLARAESVAGEKIETPAVPADAITDDEPLVLLAEPGPAFIYRDTPAEASVLDAVKRHYKSESHDACRDNRGILQRMRDRAGGAAREGRHSVFRGALLHRLDNSLVAA